MCIKIFLFMTKITFLSKNKTVLCSNLLNIFFCTIKLKIFKYVIVSFITLIEHEYC